MSRHDVIDKIIQFSHTDVRAFFMRNHNIVSEEIAHVRYDKVRDVCEVKIHDGNYSNDFDEIRITTPDRIRLIDLKINKDMMIQDYGTLNFTFKVLSNGHILGWF